MHACRVRWMVHISKENIIRVEARILMVNAERGVAIKSHKFLLGSENCTARGNFGLLDGSIIGFNYGENLIRELHEVEVEIGNSP
jgi:hypothetical protein